ncbi:A24 family peptidase [Dethiobacter alkaliphilus]|nr:prepilin peptidase [Dethiobacter alkaliphilus]
MMLSVWLMFGFVTVCMITDIIERKIYNVVVLAGLVTALVLNVIVQGFYSGAVFTLAGFFTGIFLLVIPFVFGGLGAGDVKMLGMIGAFTGYPVVIQVLLVSAIVGGVFALYTMLRQGKMFKRLKTFFLGIFCAAAARKTVHMNNLDEKDAGKNAIPYGVALSVGVIIVYVMGSMNYIMPGFNAMIF